MISITSTLDDFHNYLLDVRGYSPASAKHYKRRIELFAEALNLQNTSDITLLAYDKYLHSVKDQNYSTSTLAHISLAIRAYCKYCSRVGYPSQNWSDFEVPRRVINPVRPLEKEEVIAVFDQVPNFPDKLFFRIMYESGCRIAELLSLEVSGIHGDKFTVMGKGSRPRLCFMSTETAWYLKSYIDLMNIKDRIFTKSKMHYQTVLRQAGDRAGVKGVHPHLLRHSFATTMLQNGSNIMVIKELLGHQQVQTTQRYLHITDSDKQKDYSKNRPTL